MTKERAKAGDVWNEEALHTALELLKDGFDPKQAALIAEGGASARISGDTAAWFLMQLAQRDASAADGLYEAYLRNFGANPQVRAGELLWLGGYPFGYGEAYGFSSNDPKKIGGFGGLAIPSLAPNRRFANAFLNVMLNLLQFTLAQAQSASPSERENSSAITLFGAYYLIPEVARYKPEFLTHWHVLQQRALASTPVALQDEIRGQIETVNHNRLVAKSRERPPDSRLNAEEDALQRADKLVGCPRDRAYAELTLNLSSSGEFGRALDISDKIEELSVRGSVRDFIYYDMSSAALQRGELYGSRKHANRVDAREQRALLYIKIAALALKKGDINYALDLVGEVDRLAKNFSEPGTQAGVFLAVAGILAKAQP
ncbi:MAG: hypothetical protein ACRD8U_15980, partial [Pyrinomonadaceae bacterium]